MYTTERTYNALARLAMDAISHGEHDFTVTLKDTGDRVTITPCFDGVPSSVSDVEYWLVDCRFPWMGNSDLHKVAADLNRWTDLIAEDGAEKERLRAFRKAHCLNGVWDSHDSAGFYSDWHKDVYGFRP